MIFGKDELKTETLTAEIFLEPFGVLGADMADPQP
jgi:hypothetical protein